MKYLFIALLASFSFLSINAEAARPCKTIVEACLSAGVIQRGASRETMMSNCVKPIVAGQNISGVSVDPSVIEACRAKIANR